MYPSDVNASVAGARAPRALAVALPAFTSAIFVSAFLLFAIQPMFAKMVLPRLGGSPSVWSVAMCFFQAALLGGYAYAHLLTRYLSLLAAVVVHIGVCLVALVALPIGLAAGWDRPPLDNKEIWLIGLFAVSIGLPFVAVSANSPLLQAWFSRTGHRHAADPYFLYGASNVGSLIALLGYPILFEPFLRLQTQSLSWTIGYVALIALIAACGSLAIVSGQGVTAVIPRGRSETDGEVTWGRRLGWMGYAFIPSALLVALTAHISTDVAAAPFLWVLPLALFLLTFVITFARRPVVSHTLMLLLQPAFVIPLAVLAQWGQTRLWALFLVLNLIGYFVVAMVCHGELVRKRPAASQLTGFYLWMSVGGVLGGVFAGLIAPHVFATVIEYPVLLVASLLARPGALSRPPVRWLRDLAIGALAFGMLSLPLLLFGVNVMGDPRYVIVGVVLFAVLAAVYVKSPSLLTALVLAVFVSALAFQNERQIIETRRGFFGVNKVALSADGRFRLLYHGTTLHGAQKLTNEDGSPVERPEPLTYYHDKGPLYQAIVETRRAHGGLGKVGIIGLGSGSLACWRKPGEAWRYFEIDPIVADIASDPTYFSFLSTCSPDLPIALGDARLTVADEPDGSYDILVVDAFSSDSIPVHLMTREAISMYLSKLAPEGIVAVHISNRNMDLAPALAASAEALGIAALIHEPVAGEPMSLTYKSAARVVVFARDARSVEALSASPDWQVLEPTEGFSEWTDDYSNILGAIMAKHRADGQD
ncbi:fused MFS/spermidine synthase [Microbaculum sp. FT89]|uniref:fused MFS/spermidine synthase n=1 Tax=Microbaculum sp. FT89 TaxID=3447298 RepID=UPI003F53380B